MLPWALRALRMEAGLQRGHAGRRVWRMDLAHRCTQCHSQVVGGQSQCRVNPWHPRLPLDRCPQSRGPWEQMQQMAGPSRSIAKNTPKKDQRWKLHIWSSLLILHQEYTLQYTFLGFVLDTSHCSYFFQPGIVGSIEPPEKCQMGTLQSINSIKLREHELLSSALLAAIFIVDSQFGLMASPWRSDIYCTGLETNFLDWLHRCKSELRQHFWPLHIHKDVKQLIFPSWTILKFCQEERERDV